MNQRYNKFNHKRKIHDCSSEDIERLKSLHDKVRYGGNPQHKKNPNDFGLTPPVDPRSAKSLCDEAAVFRRTEAQQLLKSGIAHGLISEQNTPDGFPKNIWTVKQMSDGLEIPLEAIIENPVKGIYHGYPLQKTDPMYHNVLAKWRESSCLISE